MIIFNRLSYELKRNIVRYFEKISTGLTRPQFKFVTQMLYGLLEGQKANLSEIARSLIDDITLKKQLANIIKKVYLMRWRIEEYFKLKSNSSRFL